MMRSHGSPPDSIAPLIDSELCDLSSELKSATHVLEMVRALRLPVFCIGCDTDRVWDPSELCVVSFQPDTELDRGVAALMCVACTEHPQRRMRAMQIIKAECKFQSEGRLA